MKNFETFRTEEALLARIEQLKQLGFTDSELEVVSNHRISNDYVNYIDYSEIDRDHTPEVTLGDRIAAFFTGEDPEVRAFERYNLDDDVRLEAETAIQNGYYVLFVNREGYYDSPDYYDNRAEFIDEDIRDREDLNAEDKIRLYEERLRVNKDRVQAGEVEINKEVYTEQRELEIPVEREEVTIERRKIDETDDLHDFDRNLDDNETIRVPIYEEQVTVNKENVATEEIVINKKKVQDTEVVTDTVRKERINVNDENNLVDEHHVDKEEIL